MSKNSIKDLSIYVEQLLNSLDKEVKKPILSDPEEQLLLCKIDQLHESLLRMYEIAYQIAEGNIKQDIPSDNCYIGGLKDLQSSLKFLMYQVGRVAEGDYSVNIKFLGDFSQSFDHLISQLKERESVLKENAILNEELVKQQEMLLKSEMKRSNEKYKQFVNSVMDIRSYRHDMQNHLLSMTALLQSKDYSGTQTYLNSLVKDFSNLEVSPESKNYILDVLLYEKLERAKEMKTMIYKKVVIDRTLAIENKDWCIIMGNALDNCLDALKKVPEKNRELSIMVQQKHTMLSIKIENTMNESIIIKNNQVETTKKDKLNHGIGLKNICKTVQKYDGVAEVKTEGNKFCLFLLLMNI